MKVRLAGAAFCVMAAMVISLSGCGGSPAPTQDTDANSENTASVSENAAESAQPEEEEASMAEDVRQGGEEMPVANESGGETVEATFENLKYASVSDSEVCNVYLPEGEAGENGRPVIVVIHGGGFMLGDLTMGTIQPIISAALEKGYAVVSVDYRKSREAVFPAALADVKACVRWTRSNAGQYGFDADNITIWGESAGAWLALMTALTPEVESLNGDVADNAEYSSAVKALVDFYGPVEFYTMDEEFIALGQEDDATHSAADSFESAFLGQALDADKDKTYETYWETYLQSLPTNFKLAAWIQAGDNDHNVPCTQSVNFAERLAKAIGGDCVSSGIIEGAAHEDDLFYTDENLSAVFAFLESNAG